MLKPSRHWYQAPTHQTANSIPSEDRPMQDSALHFSSQTAADAYILQRRIGELDLGRTTRSRAAILMPLRERLAALEAPVYKLSDDLLSMIFLLGAGDCSDTSFAECVSKVTTRWRRLALTIPKIWSSISVDLDVRLPNRLEKLKTLADRARTCHLDLRMELRGTQFGSVKNEREAYTFLKEALPSVFKLHLSGATRYLIREEILFDKPCVNSLHTLILENAIVGDHSYLASFFDCCQALQELHLVNSSTSAPIGRTPARHSVTVPRLQALVVCSGYPRVLGCLVFPSIHKLEYRSMVFNYFDGTMIPRWVENSLQSISFEAVDFHLYNDLIPMLYSSSALEEIHFTECRFSSMSTFPLPQWLTPAGWLASTSCVLSFSRCSHPKRFLRFLGSTRDASSDKVNRIRIQDRRPILERLSSSLRTELESWVAVVEWDIDNWDNGPEDSI